MEKSKIAIKFIYGTKKYRVSYIFTMIFSFISIIISVILPLTMQNIIDKGILQKNLNILLFYVIISVILTVLENLLIYITNIRYAKIRMKYIYDTKEQVLKKLGLLNGRQCLELNSAKLMNIIEKDINEIADGLTDRIFLFVNDIISASFSLVILLKINYKIFAIILLIQGFIFCINKKIGLKVKYVTQKYRKEMDIQKAGLQDEVLNLEYLIQTNMIGFFNKKFLSSENSINSLQYKINQYLSVNIACSGTLRGVASLIVWGLGGIAAIFSKITMGEIYSINSYTNKFFSPLLRIADTSIEMKSIGISLNRLYSILDIEEVKSAGLLHTSGINKGKIEFKNVYFCYDSKSILNGCSFQILPNEVNLIVGKSGVGKSTILKLICKLWDVSKGNIYIDNIDINKFSLDYLRNQISIISQKNEIFYGTIYSNIQMDKYVKEEEVYSVCKRAGIYDEILNLEKGFNTIVGIEGKNLSGGQIQRIAIARALLKKSKIIIFDEPTSNLDAINRKKILELINSLSDYTVIVVSHDTELIEKISNVIIINSGIAQ